MSGPDDATVDGSAGRVDPETTARLLRKRLVDAPLDLPVNGQSMGTTIRSGSKVTVSAPSEPRRGEIWAFVGADSGIVVHRVRHLTEDSMTGRGDGNPLDDRTVPRSHLIGRVDAATGPDGTTRRFGSWDRWRASVRLRLREVAHRWIG